jgi:hypothetical protein
MKSRFLACLSIAVLMLAASQNSFAQRLGSVSDIFGGAWSVQQHVTPTSSLPAERAGDYKTLAGSLAKRLPEGTDLRAAALGFRSLGDFVAAVYASTNLKVPFAEVKARMMNGGDLHTAIAGLRPDADAQIEARKARAAAHEELRQS